MPIDWSLVVDIGVPLLCLILGATIDRFLERRPKLITYYGHVSSFTLQGEAETSKIHTHSVVVSNAGRRTATNVRLGHHYLPSYELAPQVACNVENLAGGGADLVLPALVPGEQVTVSYLYPPPILWRHVNAYVKSDEGMATVITVLPQRQYPKWVQNVARFFFVVGITATLYVVFVLLRKFI